MDLHGRLTIGFPSNSWKADCYWLGRDVYMIKSLVRSRFTLCALIFMKHALKYANSNHKSSQFKPL